MPGRSSIQTFRKNRNAMTFFRFPRTPHLIWLGTRSPRSDKVLTPHEVQSLLADIVTVEEKVDGANIGFSVDSAGTLRIQNRGSYLIPGTSHPQFKMLTAWLEPRRHAMADALLPHLMLFGEWCYAVHSVKYTKLPDWSLAWRRAVRSRGDRRAPGIIQARRRAG